MIFDGVGGMTLFRLIPPRNLRILLLLAGSLKTVAGHVDRALEFHLREATWTVVERLRAYSIIGGAGGRIMSLKKQNRGPIRNTSTKHRQIGPSRLPSSD